jgi:thymidylate kinase
MQKACLGLQVSLEGMEGSGTPFLLTLLQEFLQEAFPDQLVTVVEERQERLGPAFEQNLWRTLLAHTDRVGRGGAPRAETLVRLALLASDAQQLIEPVVAAGQIVLVDRGIDTFVVQHTRHLFPDVPEARLLVEATHLYTLACQWRRPPDLTFWLLDDFSTTVRRAQERAAETYRPTDLAWLRRLSDFSHAYVREHHERITLLDRRVLSNEEIVTTIQQALRAIPCHRKSTRSDGRDDTVIPERQTKEDD